MSEHAARRLAVLGIDVPELAQAIRGAELLEDYPDDARGHSALVLGYSSQRPLHAVCAFSPADMLVVITAYEPETPDWVDERTRGT